MGLRGQDRVFDQGSPGRQRQDVVKGYPPIHGPQITHQGHDFRLEHITGGLDLADVAPRIGPNGLDTVPEGGINPWQVSGQSIAKPVVMAVQGTCLTLGIELMLASDIVVAADSTTFGQIEVARGILPFGGATIRFPRAVGWGNAMRWILTGDSFPVSEAHRIGLVQEVVPHGEQYARGLELAQRVAAQAPLAVQAALANARASWHACARR